MPEDSESQNDALSTDRLLPKVYQELRQLAAARLANEHPGQTLVATALVHEAWLRLAKGDIQWESKAHFFGAAAEAMRRILIERARSKGAQKHGGGRLRVDVELESLEQDASDDQWLSLDHALTKLEAAEPQKAQLVKLRYFAGCSIKDAADLMGISTATADRYWAYARAWLQTEMKTK